MTTTTTSRADTIADFIFNATRDAYNAAGAVKELSEQMQDAAADATNKRQVLMQTIAAHANAQSWTPKEIDAACAIAGKKSNDKAMAKTLATLIAEVKLAAHPDVRAHFPHYVQLRDLAWASEEESAKAAKQAEMTPDTPLKLAFSRSYHALVAMLRHAADPETLDNPFTTVADVVGFARRNDPRRDPVKVAKQVEAMVKNLRAFYDIFPVPTVKALVEVAGLVTPDELKAEMEELDRQRAEEAARQAAEEEALIGTAVDGDGGNTLDNSEDVSTGGVDVSTTVPNDQAPRGNVSTTPDIIDALLAA